MVIISQMSFELFYFIYNEKHFSSISFLISKLNFLKWNLSCLEAARIRRTKL